MPANQNLLFHDRFGAWKMDKLDPPFSDIQKTKLSMSEIKNEIPFRSYLASLNPSSTQAGINQLVIKAVLEMMQAGYFNEVPASPDSPLGIKIVDTSDEFFSEYHDKASGNVYITSYQMDNDCGIIQAIRITANGTNYEAAQALDQTLPMHAVYVPFMLAAERKNPTFALILRNAVYAAKAMQNGESEVWIDTNSSKELWPCSSVLIALSHAFYCIIRSDIEATDQFKDQRIHAPFRNGNFPGSVGIISMVKSAVYSGCGESFGNTSVLDCSLTTPGATQASPKKDTVGALKAEFAAFNAQFNWTEEEKLFIPSFDDKTPVPQETITIARAYVQSRGMKTPMVNFLWRGITSYGKSTGVKMLACILNRPLLHQTCSTNMEVQDFLSTFVPDNGGGELKNKPSADEIFLDPETAWEKITGEAPQKEVTAQECLDEMMRRAANSGGTAKFKHIQSNYVKALSRGYIIEISEISRIREPGVLVGLNDYDQPGCVIPLVDGGYTQRHKDAIVVMTDNVGYVSCRPVDPAVIRRMAFVIDSYKMPKKFVLDRVKANTGFTDSSLLNTMYVVWEQLIKYCQEHEINEGPVSMTELERWVQMVMMDNGNLYDNAVRCLVAKATSNLEEQNEIKAAVLDPYLAH